MDRVHLFYAVLNLKFPKGYRNAEGAKFAGELLKMSDTQLKRLYLSLPKPHDVSIDPPEL